VTRRENALLKEHAVFMPASMYGLLHRREDSSIRALLAQLSRSNRTFNELEEFETVFHERMRFARGASCSLYVVAGSCSHLLGQKS
jgi:hypothetical protein